MRFRIFTIALLTSILAVQACKKSSPTPPAPSPNPPANTLTFTPSSTTTSSQTVTRTPTVTATGTPTWTTTLSLTPTWTEVPFCTDGSEIGNTGTVVGYLAAGNYLKLLRITAPADGRIIGLKLYKYDSSPGTCRAVVYGGNASAPGARLSQSNVVTTSASGNVTVDLPDVIVSSGNYYWIGILNYDFHLGMASSTDVTYEASVTYGECPLTAPVGSADIFGPMVWAQFCDPMAKTYTITPSATSTATSTVTRTRTPTFTRTATQTLTRTFTPTITFTATATVTRTVTPTPTATSTPMPCAVPTVVGWPSFINNPQTGQGRVLLYRMGGIGSPAGRLTSVSVYLTGSGSFRTCVYSDNGVGTYPATLQAQSSLAGINTQGWNVGDIPDVPVASGAYYWVGFWCTSGTANYQEQSSASDVMQWYSSVSGTLDNIFTWEGTSATNGNVTADFCP